MAWERNQDGVVMRLERPWIYLLAAGVVLLGFAAAYPFVEPAPPRNLTIAAGPEDGAYWRFAQRYQAVLAEAGIELQLRATQGSVENLALLADPAAPVDLALVQGGLAGAAPVQGLAGLGTVFLEPVWLFTRLQPAPDRLDALRGRSVAIGPPGSGTRALAEQLLLDSGLTEKDVRLEPLGGQAAADALLTGQVDVVLLVTSAQSPVVRRLATAPGIDLMSLRRAAAYAQVKPFLEQVTLHEAALDLAMGRPDREIAMLAAEASVVIREDLHPALVDMLMLALHETHAAGDVFSPPGRFPSAHGGALPLAPDAARFHERGPPLLLRYMPFWAANLIERAAILLVPVFTLLVPLLRLLPMALDWQLKSRIWRWYAELAAIERKAGNGEIEAAWDDLGRVERELGRIRVPTSHAALVYQVRQHLELIRARLPEAPMPPAST